MLHIELFTFEFENISYKKYDIELLYTIWGILKNIKGQKYNMEYINNIYNILHFIIEKVASANNMTPRIQFFVSNIQDIIKSKFRCVYNELSIDQFNVLIDIRLNKKVLVESDKDNSSDSEYVSDSDEESNSEDSNSEVEEPEDIEDLILSCLKNKGDLHKLITENDINEYIEVLIFVVINNIKYLPNTIDVLGKLRIDKNELDKLVSYSKEDLDEFALDNCKVHINYETFMSEYKKFANGAHQ